MTFVQTAQMVEIGSGWHQYWCHDASGRRAGASTAGEDFTYPVTWPDADERGAVGALQLGVLRLGVLRLGPP